MSFLAHLQSVYNSFRNTSASSRPVCDSSIDHYLFYEWMLLPSGLCAILLAFFIRRKNLCLNFLGGRPGLLYPLNIFTMENRFTVAAAFGSISFVLAEIILEAKYAIPFSGEIWVRIFVILGSVLIYGIAYFPLFAGLATRSLIGYGVSAAYAWMFAVVDFFKTSECDLDAPTRMLLIVRNLPKLVASLFLSISLTVMFLKEVKMFLFTSEKISSDVQDEATALQIIRESHYGKHIRQIFIPTLPPSKPKEGFVGKIRNLLGPFVHKWIYHRQPNFQYPARIIALFTACIIILYKVTCEILIIFVPIIEIYEYETGNILEEIGLEASPDEDPDVASLREFLYLIYYYILVFKGCLITATCFAFILGILMALHSLSSYRKNLLDLFRGDYTYIPGRDEKSNVSMLVSTVRYSGYQLAYTSWAYIIHWTIFFLLSFAVATVITLLAHGYAHIIVNLIKQFWPIPVNVIVMLLFQMLVTKFLFTQENGETFGITNRRGFFVFAYFMFFYNIFLGLISCLLRILKGIGVGALLLGRLDQSTLPRKWQWFDPGFDSYLGFIHTENYHLNPSVNTFVAILRLQTSKSNPANNATIDCDDSSRKNQLGKEEMMELDVRNEVTVKKKRSRMRWLLAYSLHNNPQLRVQRKKFLTQKRIKQEELTEKIEKEKKALKEEKRASRQNSKYNEEIRA